MKKINNIYTYNQNRAVFMSRPCLASVVKLLAENT